MAITTQTITNSLWDKNNFIDYEMLSKDMGLHGTFLEMIQSNQLKTNTRRNLISLT